MNVARGRGAGLAPSRATGSELETAGIGGSEREPGVSRREVRVPGKGACVSPANGLPSEVQGMRAQVVVLTAVVVFGAVACGARPVAGSDRP